LFDFSGTARLLPAKLIARKAQHFKSAIMKLRIDALQAGVLASEAAATGDINNEQDFSGVIVHLFGFTI
jgi:hypothetical protein